MTAKIFHYLVRLPVTLMMLLVTLIGKTLALIGHAIYAMAALAWNFLKGLGQRIANPGCQRIGLSAAIARQRQLAEAYEAAEQEDWTRAIPCWHHAASLCSNRAMYSLGECYEQGKGVERDLAIAYEFYAMADHYHYGENAKEKCDALKAFAMSRNARKLFRKELRDHWNYHL